MFSLMCVLGTCMHFVCDIFDSPTAKAILGVIFPVNETSWEHMKMIWYPFLGAALYVAISRKDIRLFGGFIVAGFIAMPIQLGLFSFYQSFTTTSVLFLDIIFYYADMILCGFLALQFIKREWCQKTWYLWILVAVIVTAGIITLTYLPGPGYVFLDNEGLEA